MGIGPGMAARSRHRDAQPPASQGAIHDQGVSRAFQGDGGRDPRGKRWLREQVAHAAQIAFAFFAHIGGEENRAGQLNFGVLQGSRNAQERRKPGAVIAGTRTMDAIVVLAGRAIGAGRKNSVQVCRKQYGAVVRRARLACEQGNGVPFAIDLRFGQPELGEAGAKPFRALTLPERRSGNGEKLQLPAAQLQFVQVYPPEGAVQPGVGGQRSQALLVAENPRLAPVLVSSSAAGSRSSRPPEGVSPVWDPYLTSTRYRPLAGAVGPAWDRLRDARIFGRSSSSRLPRPISTIVPTRFRTM